MLSFFEVLDLLILLISFPLKDNVLEHDDAKMEGLGPIRYAPAQRKRLAWSSVYEDLSIPKYGVLKYIQLYLSFFKSPL